uniref:Putative secreted peptide n=1 Tax=Anopheles braziliensis TaxID=58242 RepID=A0A2M3ZUG3_9DIPT
MTVRVARFRITVLVSVAIAVQIQPMVLCQLVLGQAGQNVRQFTVVHVGPCRVLFAVASIVTAPSFNLCQMFLRNVALEC